MYKEITFHPYQKHITFPSTAKNWNDPDAYPEASEALNGATICISSGKPWVQNYWYLGLRLDSATRVPMNPTEFGCYSTPFQWTPGSYAVWAKLYKKGARFIWIKRDASSGAGTK